MNSNQQPQIYQKNLGKRRCERNRKRSKRRSILCPIHHCHLDSVSQKYSLYADRPEQLQQRGINRKNALMLVATRTSVSLPGEWLEAFWCRCCQDTKWYHVHKSEQIYNLSLAPPELWQQATGVIDPRGNPSVGEFTRRQSRTIHYRATKDFRFVG